MRREISDWCTFQDERGGLQDAGDGGGCGQFGHLQMREGFKVKQEIWGGQSTMHNGHTNYSKLTFVLKYYSKT